MPKGTGTKLAKKARNAAKSVSCVMTVDKECKGSIRYGCPDEDAPLTNVYLMRTAFKTMPKRITVTVEAN